MLHDFCDTFERGYEIFDFSTRRDKSCSGMRSMNFLARIRARACCFAQQLLARQQNRCFEIVQSLIDMFVNAGSQNS